MRHRARSQSLIRTWQTCKSLRPYCVGVRHVRRRSTDCVRCEPIVSDHCAAAACEDRPSCEDHADNRIKGSILKTNTIRMLSLSRLRGTWRRVTGVGWSAVAFAVVVRARPIIAREEERVGTFGERSVGCLEVIPGDDKRKPTIVLSRYDAAGPPVSSIFSIARFLYRSLCGCHPRAFACCSSDLYPPRRFRVDHVLGVEATQVRSASRRLQQLVLTSAPLRFRLGSCFSAAGGDLRVCGANHCQGGAAGLQWDGFVLRTGEANR